MNALDCSICSQSQAKFTFMFFTSLLYVQFCLFPKDTASPAVTSWGTGLLHNTPRVPLQKCSRPSCSTLGTAATPVFYSLKSIQCWLFRLHVLRLSLPVSMLLAVGCWLLRFFLSLRSLPPGSWSLSSTTPARILKNFNLYLHDSCNTFAYSSLIFF